jgi:hypothetical protein
MLFDCFISRLYMHVLKLTLGKIISINFFLSFCLFSVKRPDSLFLHADGCGSVGRMVLLQVQTRAAQTAGR